MEAAAAVASRDRAFMLCHLLSIVYWAIAHQLHPAIARPALDGAVRFPRPRGAEPRHAEAYGIHPVPADETRAYRVHPPLRKRLVRRSGADAVGVPLESGAPVRMARQHVRDRGDGRVRRGLDVGAIEGEVDPGQLHPAGGGEL